MKMAIKNGLKSALLTATLMLAITFTLSCSDDGGSGSEPIKKARITGVSQKGPFVEGSKATLYELNENFVQTGKSFTDIIADNKGTFEIKSIELVSPYAMLEASGYYRNENTGAISKSPITLFAIADVREKDQINVNILTHLEYYRVLNLVEQGKSVKEAKKQAQKEIFAVFGINSDSFKDSEDMNIFGTSESDAALLAISILLQGDLSEGDFSQRLTSFSQAIKTGGSWNDEEAKAAMVEWATLAKLNDIKRNILDWGLASVVPAFEKYIYDYWVTGYGLSACSSEAQGNVEKDFVCKGGIWQKANYTDVYCFETKNCLTDSRDGITYRLATIDNLTFMIDWLKYKGEGGDIGGDINVGVSNGDNHYTITYVGYTWDEAQNVCPDGWRLPNNIESECISGYDDKCRGLNFDYPYFWSSTGYSWKQGSAQGNSPEGLSSIFCVKN